MTAIAGIQTKFGCTLSELSGIVALMGIAVIAADA